MPRITSLALALLLACSGGEPYPVVIPSNPFTPAQTLRSLPDGMERIHPDLYHGTSRSALRSIVDRAVETVEGPYDWPAMLIEMLRIVAAVSHEGRDGHTRILPAPQESFTWYPLRLYEFPDGVYVTGAMRSQDASAVGGKVIAIGDTPIAEVLRMVEPLVSRDGPATVPAFRPAFLVNAEVLAGLGLAERKRARYTIEADGRPREITLESIGHDMHIGWQDIQWEGDYMPHLPPREGVLFTTRPREGAWTQMLDGGHAYLRMRRVTEPGPSLVTLVDDLMREKPRRLTIDLRGNPGGDNTTFPPFVARLTSPDTNRTGFLRVLIDHGTFSAAAQLAAELDARTKATLMGETTGGAATTFGDAERWKLAGAPITIHVSAKRWDWPGETRLGIDPDVAVTLTAADYFAGRDPVLTR